MVHSPAIRLELCYYECPPGEERQHAWGELAGSFHRLTTIGDELMEAAKHRRIEKALARVQLHVETYLARAYELRDRAVSLTQTVFPEEPQLGALKKPEKRAACIERLARKDQRFAVALDELLGLLDDDTLLRNTHTHTNYVALRLFTSENNFDPQDTWDHLKDRPQAPVFRRLLRRAIQKVAVQYAVRIQGICKAGWTLADSADRMIRAAPR